MESIKIKYAIIVWLHPALENAGRGCGRPPRRGSLRGVEDAAWRPRICRRHGLDVFSEMRP